MEMVSLGALLGGILCEINTKTLQFNKYCKGLPVKASKQQKSFFAVLLLCLNGMQIKL